MKCAPNHSFRNGNRIMFTESSRGHDPVAMILFALTVLLSFSVCVCCTSGAKSGDDEPLEVNKFEKLERQGKCNSKAPTASCGR